MVTLSRRLLAHLTHLSCHIKARTRFDADTGMPSSLLRVDIGISHDIEEPNGITPAEEASEPEPTVEMETPLENGNLDTGDLASGDLGSANKHEHTDMDGDIDLDVTREPKRIKIEAEDEQEPTSTTTNGDGHATDQEAEPLSDTEQTQESSAPHVQEEEDEVCYHLVTSVGFEKRAVDDLSNFNP